MKVLTINGMMVWMTQLTPDSEIYIHSQIGELHQILAIIHPSEMTILRQANIDVKMI